MSNPAGTAAPTDTFVALMAEAHNAPTIREAHELERRARAVAKRHGLNEFDLEPAVLAAVFASTSDAELEQAAGDPSRRANVRAEQRRRAELAAPVVHLMSDDLLDACDTAAPGGLHLAPFTTPEAITCAACLELVDADRQRTVDADHADARERF